PWGVGVHVSRRPAPIRVEVDLGFRARPVSRPVGDESTFLGCVWEDAGFPSRGVSATRRTHGAVCAWRWSTPWSRRRAQERRLPSQAKSPCCSFGETACSAAGRAHRRFESRYRRGDLPTTCPWCGRERAAARRRRVGAAPFGTIGTSTQLRR